MKTLEIWKDIPEYEGLYRISNQGRIISLRSSMLRKDVQSGSGYRAIQLSDMNCKKSHHYVHRLVAITFIGLTGIGRCEYELWKNEYPH